LGRLKTITNALGQTTAYTYDKNGNLLAEKNHLGNTTQYVYDGINRLVEQRYGLNHIVKQLRYNNANVQISSFDALHNETRYLYDRNLRQTGTVDAKGMITSSLR
jgi:YD repeat-containing protein